MLTPFPVIHVMNINTDRLASYLRQFVLVNVVITKGGGDIVRPRRKAETTVGGSDDCVASLKIFIK